MLTPLTWQLGKSPNKYGSYKGKPCKPLLNTMIESMHMYMYNIKLLCCMWIIKLESWINEYNVCILYVKLLSYVSC